MLFLLTERKIRMNKKQKKALKRAMACSLALGSVGAIVLPTSQAIVYAAVTMKTVGPASNPHRPSNFPQNGDLERLILWEQPRDDSPEVEVHGISGAEKHQLTEAPRSQHAQDHCGDGPDEIYRSFQDKGGVGVDFPLSSLSSSSEITFNYTNVGAYRGRPVDCKVTFHDLQPFGKEQTGRIKASNSMGRGWVAAGLASWQTKLEFYQNGNPVYLKDAKSLFTITSLNPDKNTSDGEKVAYPQAVDGVGYVTSDTILSTNGDYFQGDFKKGSDEPGDPNRWVDNLFDPTFAKGSVSFEADPSRPYHNFWFKPYEEYDQMFMWFTIKTDAIWEKTDITKLKRSWPERQSLPNGGSRRFNPNLPVGAEQVIRDGAEGYRERIWTETVYPDGNVTRDVTPWENHPGSDRLVEFGPARRSKSESKDISYQTIRRPNPKMKNHTEKVVQRGRVGHQERKLTWLVNPETEEKVSGSEKGGNWVTTQEKQDEIIEYGVPHPPKIWGVHPTMISDGERLNLMHGISADDFDDGDLSDRIKMSGEVDYSKDGSYPITYTVTDSDGDKDTVVTNVIVKRFPVEEMIRNLKNIYNNLQENINKLPDQVREKVKNRLKPQLDEIGKAIKDLENTDHVQRQQFDDLIKRIEAVEKDIDGLKDKDQVLAGEIGDVENHLNDLKDHVSQLADQIEKHNNWIESLEKRVHRLEEHTTKTMSRVENLKDKLDNYEKNMDQASSRYRALLKDLKEAIDTNQSTLKDYQDTLGHIGKDISQQTDQLDQVEQHLEEMDKHLDQITPQVDDQGKQLDALMDRFKPFDQGLADAQTHITRLEEQTKRLKDQLGALTDQETQEAQALKDKIQTNLQALTTLKQHYEDLEGKVFTHDDDFKHAQEDLQRLNDQLKGLDEDVQKQGKALDSLTQRIESSEDTFEKIKETLIRKEEQAKALDKQVQDLDGRFGVDKATLIKQLEKAKKALDQAKDLLNQADQEDKDQQQQMKADQARVKQAKALLDDAGKTLDQEKETLDQIDQSLHQTKEGVGKLHDQILKAEKKKDLLAQLIEQTFGDQDLKALTQTAQETHKQLEELQNQTSALKPIADKGKTQNELLKETINTVTKATQAMQENIANYLSHESEMNRRTDQTGEKILKAKEVFLSLQKDLDAIEQSKDQANEGLNQLQSANDKIQDQAAPTLMNKLINAVTKPFEDFKKAQALHAQEDLPKAEQAVSTTSEKKEGKDKSLDRSNESKGKSMPKTGLRNPIYLLLSGLAVVIASGILYLKGTFKKKEDQSKK